MPRKARIVVPELPHHITARGNRREDIFNDEDDRKVYLDLLLRYSELHGVKIYAYCLMTNHIHIVAAPPAEIALCDMMRALQMNYSTYFNRRNCQAGKLWGGRFFSCVLDDSHFLSAIRYVETNPVRAGLVRKAVAYKWSSAAGHSGRHADSLLSEDLLSGLEFGKNWEAWLCEGTVAEEEKLRHCTRKELPAGSEEFVKKLEQKLGRKLSPKPMGRPKKK
jgi:putative transposase